MEGVDYSETFASVANMTYLWMVLAMVAMEDPELQQLDVKRHSSMACSRRTSRWSSQRDSGFSGKEQLMCKLERSLYGLKQAPSAWYEGFHAHLVKQQL